MHHIKKTRLIIACGLLFLAIGAAAQSQTVDLTKAAVAGNKNASGAKQDVLANYLQVAANNLSSNNKGVSLKLNWFALNLMDSVHKYNDKNYLRTAWQRNGQFMFAGGIDNNNKFNSFGAGLNYNLVNRRDAALADFSSVYQQAYTEIAAIEKTSRIKYKGNIEKAVKSKLAAIILELYTQSITKPGQPIDSLREMVAKKMGAFPADDGKQDAGMVLKLQTTLNFAITNKDTIGLGHAGDAWGQYLADQMLGQVMNSYVNSNEKKTTLFAPYLDKNTAEQMFNGMDTLVKHNAYLQNPKLKARGIADAYQKVQQEYDAMVKYVALQPLFTAGYNYTYGSGTVFSSHIASLQYVESFTADSGRKTYDFTSSLSDTLTSQLPGRGQALNRNIGALQAGLNAVLLTQNKKSLVELTIGLEDDVVFSGVMNGENRDKFYFNSVLRARLPNTPWMKISIKYDPHTANVLGFLDFTYNLDNTP